MNAKQTERLHKRYAALVACDHDALVQRIVRLEQAAENVLAMSAVPNEFGGITYRDHCGAMGDLRRVYNEEV